MIIRIPSNSQSASHLRHRLIIRVIRYLHALSMVSILKSLLKLPLVNGLIFLRLYF